MAARANVERLVKRYLDLVVEISPENATALGLHARDGELDTRDRASFERDLQREEDLLAEVDRMKGGPLSRAAQIDRALLRSALSVDIARKRSLDPLARQPHAYTTPLGALFAMMSRDYAPADVRARQVLLRMGKIPAVLDQAKTNLKTPPRVWTDVGIDRARGASAFLASVRGFLHASLPNRQSEIDAAVERTERAFLEYAAFLEREVRPRSVPEFAAGRPLFVSLLREEYFLDETPEALRAVAEKVLAETHREMTRIAARVDPHARHWKDVVLRIKEKHPPRAELIQAYRHEVFRARKFLVDRDVMSFPPDDDCQVIETPAFLRSTVSAAYDEPPPLGDGTRGYFFVTPVDAKASEAEARELLREHNVGDLVDTAVHEAYPGHHLQLSWGRRQSSLIRRVVSPSVFTEGWALYAEELMAELGYYTDEERLMQLRWVLVRAVRVILDIGLHTENMSVEDAVLRLMKETAMERSLAVSEVKRYTIDPAQPLSYLIGREKIFAMRDGYKARLGRAYTLKRFHDRVLQSGSLPPGLLARELEDEARP